MQWKAVSRKAMANAVAAAFALALMSVGGLAASDFEGTWKVKDKDGRPFEITLSADGSAQKSAPKSADGSAQKSAPNEGTGKWKEEANAAVITWDNGWSEKITKEGDQYKRAGFRKGAPLDGPPVFTTGNIEKAQ
jgi:hypothetical protein